MNKNNSNQGGHGLSKYRLTIETDNADEIVSLLADKLLEKRKITGAPGPYTPVLDGQVKEKAPNPEAKKWASFADIWNAEKEAAGGDESLAINNLKNKMVNAGIEGSFSKSPKDLQTAFLQNYKGPNE